MPSVRAFPPETASGFESANSEIIRAIQQRDLLNKWLVLYTTQQRAPEISAYDPGLQDNDRGKLVFYTVSPAADRPHIVIGSYGTLIGEAYGQIGLGQELSDYLGPDRAAYIVPLYEECVRRQLPVYTISTLQDRDGRQVDLERLLLPFGNHERITHIVGAFETISPDGYFQLRRLAADSIPADHLRVVIDRDLHFRPPPRIPPHHRVEFD